MDYGLVSAGAGAIAGMIQTNSANQVANINAAAAQYVRGKNNEVVAEENKRDSILTGIQRWKQNLYNSRVYANTATDQEMLTTNWNRQRDAMTRSNFAEQVGYAEQAGRQQAMAAASGITGSVVDVLNLTLQQKKGQEDTQRADAGRQMQSDESMREITQWGADMDKVDTSVILDNPRVPDFGINFVQQKSLLSGVSIGDVKTISQGIGNTFSFSSPERASWANVDYQATRDN